jgi:hypothetical protein
MFFVVFCFFANLNAVFFSSIDVLKNKSIVNDYLGYYGVPYQVVKLFIQTCPLVSYCSTVLVISNLCYLCMLMHSFYFVSQCVPNKVVPNRTKMHLLNMILSKKCGSRFQMDLIEMPPFQSYSYILRVVDHLSKYGYVRPVKTRTSLEVGRALVTIVAKSITFRILQFDNGAEVCSPMLRCLLFCICVK